MLLYEPHVTGPTPPAGSEVWWRADDKRYANFDPWDEDGCSGSHLRIEFTPFEVVRHTPRGVWLRGWMGSPFFVNGLAAKQTAVPTQALALKDLIARKKLHVYFAGARLKRAEEHLEAAEKALRQITGGK